MRPRFSALNRSGLRAASSSAPALTRHNMGLCGAPFSSDPPRSAGSFNRIVQS
jgi:hypothetical protein